MPTLLLNKPFRVLSQFTSTDDKATLSVHVDQPGVYPAGRLDYDSEGLLLLTSDGRLQARLSSPRHQVVKRYYAQVEGSPTAAATACVHLCAGVELKDGPARALNASVSEPPRLWHREPPIRVRQSVPDTWICLTLDEGRNRQVRRMTAAAGVPTLRLIRWSIGPFDLGDLLPGQSRTLEDRVAWRRLQSTARRP